MYSLKLAEAVARREPFNERTYMPDCYARFYAEGPARVNLA